MRILVADRFPSHHLAALDEQGHDCAYEPELAAEDLHAAVDDVEVLVVRGTPVSAEVLAGAERMRLVIRAGSGTNTIACAEAADRGIAVCNVPGGNAAAVAELALGLMLALDRNIPDTVADLRSGRWRKEHWSQAQGLKGRRLGIVGLGQVGLALAQRAAALEMNLHGIEAPARDRATRARLDRLGMTMLGDLWQLAETCDILSLHIPLTAETRGIVGTELLARVAPGAWIINTARGELVDEDALLAAMDDKGVRAGLDVFADEPSAGDASFSSRLATHPNVYGTHHIGASTRQAQDAVASEVVRMVASFADGELVHCVNGVDIRPAVSMTGDRVRHDGMAP